MTDYDFDSSGLVFTEAARDVDAEVRAEALIRGKIAAATFWPYLAEAASETEFGHRLALVEDRLAEQVPAGVLEPVQASLAADWKLLHTARLEEQQAATRERGEQIRATAAQVHASGVQSDQEFYDQQSHRWVSVAQRVVGPAGMPDLMDAYRSRTADLANPESYLPGVGWQVSAANSASGYTLPARYQLPEDLRGNQHATEGYRDARYHAANGYDWRLADGDSFTLQHQDYQRGYGRAHDDLKAGSRHGKQAYIDPSDAQRYSAYPDLNPPVDNGPLQGPDGFVTDPQPDNSGASNAVIQQRQLTPGQWTVTPGSEWPVRPNAADPTQVPRTAAWNPGHDVPANGVVKGHYVLHNGQWGQVTHILDNEDGSTDLTIGSGGYGGIKHVEPGETVRTAHPKELDARHSSMRRVVGGVDVTGWPENAIQQLLRGMASFDRMAGEGIVPTPGPNPNYFSQGSDGLAGPPSFPENPSGQIEPKTDNRTDDIYGAVPPQVSPGSAAGTADGQGYSRQAPGASATASRHPFFDRTAAGNVDSSGWFTTRREGYPKAETDCGHKFFDNTGRCKECGYSAADDLNHEDWVRGTFGDKGAEHADALLRDNHIGPTRYSSRTAAGGEVRCGECGAHLTRGEEGAGAFGPAWNDEHGRPNAGEPGVRESGWHWHHPAENRPPISNPAVHTFDSTGEAYDRSQTEDHIKDGDVLSVPREGVHGYLYKAWPIAVAHPGDPGAFHTFTHGSHEPAAYEDQGRYGASVAKAREVAAQHGHTGRRTAAFDGSHVTHYVGWARSQGKNPDDVETLKAYEREPGVSRGHTNFLADQLYIGGGDSDWRRNAKIAGGFGGKQATGHLGATDGRIVGHCDHCRNPVRYHTNENGVDELRHLFNNDNRCSTGQRAKASLNRVSAFFDPNDPSVHAVASMTVRAEDLSRTRPTLDNPSGAGDEFTANTWDNALSQRPLQSAQDRHINTPIQPREPIRTIDSSPRDNDLDENRNQNSMARETSLQEEFLRTVEQIMEMH